MSSIGKFIRYILTVSFFFSLFTLSVFSQSKLIVESNNAQVNELTDYYLNFETTIGDYAQINKGQLVITIPSGFSVESLDSVEIIDDYKHINYTIQTIDSDLQSLRIYLSRDKSIGSFDDDDDYPSDTTLPIHVSVRLSKIKNPIQKGDYQFSLLGLRDNQKIAIGPLLSEPFTITSASIYSIMVTPSEDISIKAGTTQPFSASAFDQYGNKIEGTVFQWSIFECVNCIGQFTDSSLFVTRVGEGVAQATAGGVSGFSGQITVTPGDLSRMTLQVHDTQFVGNIINHDAAIILYDAYNNLKTDYNLAETPIELVLSGGELSNNLLDNNDFLVGGVVRIKDFEIMYEGQSGEFPLYADNGLLSSNIVNVNFNNYDIVDVLNILGETISSVFVGHTTTAKVLIKNSSNLKPDSLISISVYWQSTPESMVTYLVNPPEVGAVGEVEIELPVLTQADFTDELVVMSQTKFVYQGDIFTTQSEKRFSVDVLDISQLTLVDDSFKPDTIIYQVPFDISFAVQADGFIQSIDSTQLSIALIDRSTHTAVADFYQGNPAPLSMVDGVISYGNLPAVLNSENTFSNGWYDVVLDYQLFSEGNMLTLSEPVVDSIYIYFDNGISLIAGSLSPKIVYAGTNVSFEFQLNLESSQPYAFHGSLSQFKIYDDSISSSTNLFLGRDSLYPGENVLRSASISIQPEQEGSDLIAEAVFKFCVPGIDDTLTYSITFDSLVHVLELPLVQIIDLEVVAPNAPIVNSSQEIQFKAAVANLSSNVLDSVELELKTIDGLSQVVEPIKTAYDVQPFDTVFLFFDVVAASSAQSLPESFRVDLYDNSLGTTDPVNNSAFLIIEDPALLEISYRINGLENAEGIVVKQGEQIHIQLDVENHGTAEVNDGSYEFIVNGLNSNQPDTFTGFFCSDSTLDFSFTAPLFDTLLEFHFSVVETPLDINYNAPAKIVNESFGFSVLNVSSDAEVIMEAVFLGTNLVLPGRSKELFELSITNNSNSALNSIQIEYLDLNVFSPSHESVNVGEVINVGSTYFTEGDEKITSTTAGGNELMFWFSDFTIAPQETRTIRLVAEFKKSSHKELLLELLPQDSKATYIDGPNMGQNVIIKSIHSGDEILLYHVVFKGSSLDESFVVENNPFNPTVKPVQFVFELTEEAPVEFQMFTLTGEEVYRMYYPAGSIGASAGENIIEWDGHNNSGEIVLNGVYIASIINKLTGEYARIKVAVVK